MIDFDALELLLEDASGVRLELIGGVNAARDGSTSVDLGLHLVLALDLTELGDLPLGVSGYGSALTRWLAGVALVHAVALLILRLVVVAGLIWDSDLVGVLVDRIVVSSLTVTSTSTIFSIKPLNLSINQL